MKKFVSILFLSFTVFTAALGQFRVTSEGYAQVDYNSGNQSLTFGNNASQEYPRGAWAIEHWNGGLNYWIPWPNQYICSGNYVLFIEDYTGYIGIQNGNPSYHLDVNGDIATYGTLRIASDERFKKDIKNLGNSLGSLKKLDGVSFKMRKVKPQESSISLDSIKDPVKYQTLLADKNRMGNDEYGSKDRFGFVAQELKEVFPDLVEEDKDGYLNIDYIGLIPVLVEAIKELSARIETIENNCCKDGSSLKSGQVTTNSGNLPGTSEAKLYQNSPNPFSSQTVIRFEIPEAVGNAQLYICNMTGTLLKTINIAQRGAGSLTINGNELNAGMYLYSLVTDGKIADTKQMLLTE